MAVAKSETGGLSVEERAVFFDVIEPTLLINNLEQFFRWTQTELQRIFPHGMLVCGMGHINKEGAKIRHVMSCNFPQEYLQTLQRSNDMINSPIIAKWMEERQPILFEPHDDNLIKLSAPSAWLDNFHRFGLHNLVAHGQCDVNSQTTSYFSFSKIPGSLSPRHADLVKLLVPHLHAALARAVVNLPVSARKPKLHQFHLSRREMDILKRLADGKTNKEIAQVLCISEATVKNHVHSILARLNVKSRTQAVTKAIGHKLVSARRR
jgi:transcriptional regulator EpsA